MASFPDAADEDDEMRSEYDFRALKGVVRGKYADDDVSERIRVIRLDPDVSAAFPDDAAVNSALRSYLENHPSEPTH